MIQSLRRLQNIAFALLLIFLAGAPAFAQDAVQDRLAGQWRTNCKEDGVSLTFEFAVTGGQLAFDDGSEAAGAKPVRARADGTAIVLTVDGKPWRLTDAGNGKLRSAAMPDGWASAEKQTFSRCVTPADRSAIKLMTQQLKQISAGMPPDDVIFIDSRARGGCKAIQYQSLSFDLVGPLGFSAGRSNSFAVGEALADGKKVSLPRDELSNWKVEKAEAAPGGYRITLTELIPPNGSRGDTTTITLLLDGNKASIPEWKRTYLRCPDAALAAK